MTENDMNGDDGLAESYEKMMCRKSNRRMMLLIVLLGLLGACLFIMIPKPFKVTYDAVQYQCGNVKFEKRMKITFDGYYFSKPFSKDRFQGTVLIGDKKMTLCEFPVDQTGEFLQGKEQNKDEYTIFGTIYAQKKLRSITIWIPENGEWSNADGKVLSAPCKSRGEAVSITNDLAMEWTKVRVK